MGLRHASRLIVAGVFVAVAAFPRGSLGFSPALAGLSALPRLGFRSSSLLQLRARGGGGKGDKMPNGVKKENLPSKICVTCNRPFTWRKKWERCWDEVTTCSKSCNAARRKLKQEGAGGEVASASDSDGGGSGGEGRGAGGEEVSERKAAKKAVKAQKRAQRQGKGDPSTGQKRCDLCGEGVDLLIRCQIDASGEWRMVCNTGAGGCWESVSGGVTDGDAAHPFYRYGGLWKNRNAQQPEQGKDGRGGGGEGEEEAVAVQ